MPVVSRQDGFRFLFYANEGSPVSGCASIVLRDGIDAKFWLWPQVRPAYNDGFNAKALRELTEIIERHRDRIAEAWDEFFGKG